MRHPFGPTASSLRLRGTRFISPRVSSLLLGATLAAGVLLVAPHTPRAWAAPTVGGDENGPKVQIVSPAYQDVLKGRARILVAVKVTQYNPSTIQLFLDDKPASQLLPLSSFASSTFDWDTRLTADGPHKLSVRVTDTQGFRGWAEVSVYVNNQNVRDTVAPDLDWGNVEPFQQLSGQAQIQLEAKDNFGVKWIIVSLNPVNKATQQPAQRSWLLSKPPYNFNLDTTKIADGLYALSARAWDSMEQEGKSPTLTVGVVNSPVNATTVAESLDGLKAMAKAQGQTTTRATKTPAPKTNFVEKPPTPKSDGYSGGTAKATAPKTPKAAGSSIPPGYTLLNPKITTPQTGAQGNKATTASSAMKPRVTPPTIARNSVSTENAATTAPTLTEPSNLEATTVTPEVNAEGTSTENDATLVARATPPETTSSATLSAPGTSADVLAPSISDGAQAGADKGTDPVLVARLGAPEVAPRTVVESGDATLSSHETAVASALAPARVPQADVVPQELVQVARVALPVAATRREEKPVVSTSAPKAQSVKIAVPAPAPTGTALLPAAPGTTRRASGSSKVVVRQTHQRNPHVVNKIAEKETPVKAPATVVAEVPEVTPEVAPTTVPQLSQPSNPTTQAEGVLTRGHGAAAVQKETASRIAALPKTGSADGRSVEVTPSVTMAHPVITVSPVKVAFDKSLPSFYQAKHTTTLRAVAAHYGLPVELVAATNNWTSDMKVLAGMKVQLPRQVQLSYNGQKLRGDVASLMAADTTFTAMRFLFEHTGGTIKWDAAKQEVVARKGGSTVRVKIGSKTATVNNKEVMMQLAAFLFEGRTMVPARFFEEGLNAQVEWNPQTGHLVVAMAG